MPKTVRVKLLREHRVDDVLYPEGYVINLSHREAWLFVRLGIAEIAEPERAVFEAPEER